MRQDAGKQFYQLVVVAWLTFSVGSVLLALVSWHQLTVQLAVGQQTVAIRDGLSKLLKSLQDLETGERGYVITGRKEFLQPFNQAETNLPVEFNQLLSLVHDDPPMLEAVTRLQTETEACLIWQHEVISTRDKGFDKAAALVATGKLRDMMGQMRSQAGQLDQVCRARLVSNRQDVTNRVFRANLTSLVAGTFGIGAGLLALWLARVALKHQVHERALTEAKLAAEHSSQEKTLFLANMSHEIRTPMNAILGFSELLQDELREPRHRQHLQSIRSSADSLLLLINDILDMSKIEAGVLQLRPEPTDLREICDFLRSLFSEPAAKKGLKLEFSVVENLPHSLLLDRIRLRQILINLIGNAVKFTDQGGIEVQVSWEKQQTTSHVTLVMEVRDTGVGIPVDKRDAIFKPFVQAGAHRDKEKQGTGLGLAIVKRLTEIMGGTVTVTSVMGQGSAFHLRFPDLPISARLPASEKSAPAGDEVNFDALRPATLLIVDDNRTNCELIAGMFAGSHHRLYFGYSGEEAVAKTRELKPDILLLDVRMPGMDGDEALAEIRKMPGLEFLPVIAVTASSLTDQDNSQKERFSGFVRKPFTRRELFDELADFLPRNPKTDSPTEAAGADHSPVAAVPTAPAPKELVAQLRQLIAEPWPSIRDSVAVNESKAFAQGLEGLGQRWRCKPLGHYAQQLLRDAEDYAVTDLEKHLGEFAALVEQLDGNSPP